MVLRRDYDEEHQEEWCPKCDEHFKPNINHCSCYKKTKKEKEEDKKKREIALKKVAKELGLVFKKRKQK